MKKENKKYVDDFLSHSDEIGDDILEDFEALLGKKPFIFEILKERPESFVAGAIADYLTLRPASLDDKTAELVTIAASASANANKCLNLHIIAAEKAGATKEEILDSILIACMVGRTKLLASSLRAYKNHFPDD